MGDTVSFENYVGSKITSISSDGKKVKLKIPGIGPMGASIDQIKVLQKSLRGGEPSRDGMGAEGMADPFGAIFSKTSKTSRSSGADQRSAHIGTGVGAETGVETGERGEREERKCLPKREQ